VFIIILAAIKIKIKSRKNHFYEIDIVSKMAWLDEEEEVRDNHTIGIISFFS